MKSRCKVDPSLEKKGRQTQTQIKTQIKTQTQTLKQTETQIQTQIQQAPKTGVGES